MLGDLSFNTGALGIARSTAGDQPKAFRSHFAITEHRAQL